MADVISATVFICHIVGQACSHRKRQRTAALQDTGAISKARRFPQGFGVRLSSAAFDNFPYRLNF
jgi:hypothetical protein